MPNASEKQLKLFAKTKNKHYKMFFKLSTQGDNTTLSEKAINLCQVEIGTDTFTFGGISEKFYDKMVTKYHTN